MESFAGVSENLIQCGPNSVYLRVGWIGIEGARDIGLGTSLVARWEIHRVHQQRAERSAIAQAENHADPVQWRNRSESYGRSRRQ